VFLLNDIPDVDFFFQSVHHPTVNFGYYVNAGGKEHSLWTAQLLRL